MTRIVLTCPHTHAGKSYGIGDRIEVDADRARGVGDRRPEIQVLEDAREDRAGGLEVERDAHQAHQRLQQPGLHRRERDDRAGGEHLPADQGAAVAKAAITSGVARKEITDWEDYTNHLREMMGYDNKLLRSFTDMAKANPKRVVFAEANHVNMLKAAAEAKAEGICFPILLGNEERLAKIVGGVAVIKVGAATEVEMKDKKLRIEDALNATKAAVQEGVVAGGGTAPINAIPAVRALCDTLEGDERTGAKIVLKALEAPLRQIAKNAGLEGSVIIDKIISANKPNYGFDAQNEVFVEDMIAAGIVDPTKVTRSALENAASVAEMVLTTESLVADLPEPPAPAAPAGGDMGGMY